jgi:hypothetical protein
MMGPMFEFITVVPTRMVMNPTKMVMNGIIWDGIRQSVTVIPRSSCIGHVRNRCRRAPGEIQDLPELAHRWVLSEWTKGQANAA